MLCRSRYVPKGAENNNTHGYALQEFVGSLPIGGLKIPPELAETLSPAERGYVQKKVVLPARQAAEQSRRLSEEQRRAQEVRERDPLWRLEEALRLLTNAGRLASEEGRGIDAAKVAALGNALEKLARGGEGTARPF